MVPAPAHGDDRRLAEAAAWRVRMEEPDAETSEGFKAWLARDPANPAAWREAEALWSGLGELATTPEMLAARRDALERARRASTSLRRPRLRRPVALAAGLSVALLVATAAGVLAWRSTQPQTYRTAHGERRIVRLADGSKVTLDSDSLVSVQLGRTARILDLAAGRARFDVAHDAQRPFRVSAGSRTVTATGTSFEVERLGAEVRVVLIEGHVLVTETPRSGATAPSAPPLRLAPGDRLTAAPDLPQARLDRVDLNRVTAWQAGKLVFDDQPLSEVVQEVSRYTDTPVRIGDAEAGALRISGVFRTGDLATFLDAVTRYLPVTSEVTPEGVVLRSGSRRG